MTMSDLRAFTAGALARSPHIKTLARCDALWNAAYGAHMQGADGDAIALLYEGIEIARPFGQTMQMATTLLLLGQIRQEQEDFAEAARHFLEALSIAHVLGNNALVGQLHFFLALVASGRGNHQQAIELATNAVTAIRASDGSPQLIANAVEVRGAVLAVAGHHSQAAVTLRDGYLAFIESGEYATAPLALAGLSYVSQCLGRTNDTAVLVGFTDALCRRHNVVLFMPERQLYERATSRTRAALGDALFEEAFELGRTLSFEEIATLVNTIADAQQAPSSTAQESRQNDSSGLSPRELEVLRLITEGKPDREIAAELSISPRTVTTHVTNILNKLGLSSRSAAAAYAARHGLV
jgi:DNA-binding CsgD family transcriptional regulator